MRLREPCGYLNHFTLLQPDEETKSLEGAKIRHMLQLNDEKIIPLVLIRKQ